MSLFESGIRPLVDDYLQKKSEEVRDYGKYWSASSAGYCMRKLIFERLGVPRVTPLDARTTRVFEVGHVFHEWMQRITKDAGISIAQEVELQDEGLMVRGHFDDLVLVDNNLILYDYKTVNSRAFTWVKKNGGAMSYFHRFQLGTYMYMLRNGAWPKTVITETGAMIKYLSEARILKISKDDLRMDEQQLLWDAELEADILAFWNTLNHFLKEKKIPPCTCADNEGGFMAREAYNPYFYEGEPCSLKWYKQCKEKGLIKEIK